MAIEIDSEAVASTLALFDRIRAAARDGGTDEAHALLWDHAEPIRAYLQSFELARQDDHFFRAIGKLWLPPESDEPQGSFIEAYVNDALARFFNTIDLIFNTFNGKVLEIGANPYLFTILLKKIFDYDLVLTNYFDSNVYRKAVAKGQQRIASRAFAESYVFDYVTLNVELSHYPFKKNELDLILFCEVLEHVVVDPMKCFPKLHSVLRPGGKLIVTTPNSVRLINFAHMLAGKNFFDRYHPENGIYGRHNREFSLSEVVGILESNGFEIRTAKTVDRYNYDLCAMSVDSYDEQVKLPWSGTQLRDILSSIEHANASDRGDNIYVVAEKI
jgi:SAM-dependent methyltransferase